MAEATNPGYLYVAKDPEETEEIYKVGVSKNPKKRMGQLTGTGKKHSEPFEIMLCYPVLDMKKAEKHTFNLLHDYRYNQRKEFFECSLEKINKAANSVQRHINLEKSLVQPMSEDEIDQLQSRETI